MTQCRSIRFVFEQMQMDYLQLYERERESAVDGGGV
jgi:hypothetical protein